MHLIVLIYFSVVLSSQTQQVDWLFSKLELCQRGYRNAISFCVILQLIWKRILLKLVMLVLQEQQLLEPRLSHMCAVGIEHQSPSLCSSAMEPSRWERSTTTLQDEIVILDNSMSAQSLLLPGSFLCVTRVWTASLTSCIWNTYLIHILARASCTIVKTGGSHMYTVEWWWDCTIITKEI